MQSNDDHKEGISVNIAKIMIPKACTVFLHDRQTVRQGWEIMTRYGYTAIPVLDAQQHYIGSVSEGDFLRYILKTGSMDRQEMEASRVEALVRRDFCPPISIEADAAEVINASLNQNFVPVVDSRNTLCGILTRRGVIAYLAANRASDSKPCVPCDPSHSDL